MTEEQWGSVGRRVSAYRRLKGLTAEQLASRVEGLTRVGLSKIENGSRTNVPLDLLTAIAWELQVSPVTLMYPLEDPDAVIEINGEQVTSNVLAGVLFGALVDHPDAQDMDDSVRTSAAVVNANTRLAFAEAAIEAREGGEAVVKQATANAKGQREYLATLRRGLQAARRRGSA